MTNDQRKQNIILPKGLWERTLGHWWMEAVGVVLEHHMPETISTTVNHSAWIDLENKHIDLATVY